MKIAKDFVLLTNENGEYRKATCYDDASHVAEAITMSVFGFEVALVTDNNPLNIWDEDDSGCPVNQGRFFFVGGKA